MQKVAVDKPIHDEHRAEKAKQQDVLLNYNINHRNKMKLP